MSSGPAKFTQAILKIDRLSSSAPVLAKIYRLLKDPDSNIEDITKLIKTDQAMTVNIMRLANNPHYGSAVHHTSVMGAVSSVGLREVFKMVELSLARQMFARDLDYYGITADEYWKTSIMAALLTESLAKCIDQDDRTAYLIGLLHATGRVLINQVLRDLNFSVRWNPAQPLREWETQAIGFDSAEAGSLLLRRWYFPEAICEVIQNQFIDPPIGIIASILHFVVRTVPLKSADYPLKVPQQEDPFLLSHGVTTEKLLEIFEQITQQFGMINAMIRD